MKIDKFETGCDGIKLRGQLFLPDNFNRRIIVPLCHGIPREKKSDADTGYLPIAERLVSLGHAALIFNFRGCGISDGDFDIVGWGRDLVAIADALAADKVAGKIVPWGFSGGAAASVYAAWRSKRISAVALFACPAEFDSLDKIPQTAGLVEYFRKVGIIRDPQFPQDAEKWLRGFQEINPQKYISAISPRPVLIVHGTADDTVPADHAETLYYAAGNPKTLEIIHDAPHRLRQCAEAMDKGIDWLAKL